MIWDFALNYGKTIKAINVDEDNKVYTSVNGVLFTKSMYTLIQYPLASTASTYSIPKETTEIAYGAFGDGGNIFCPKNLQNLHLSENVKVIGSGNLGNGYRDEAPGEDANVSTIGNYLEKLQKIFEDGLYME